MICCEIRKVQTSAKGKGGRFSRLRGTGLLVLLTVLLLSGGRLPAQTTAGTILGNVTDVTGAAVPDAAVTLTNLGTQAKQAVQAGARGDYQFVNLLPGSYSVDIEKQGFSHLKRGPISVEVQASVKIDAILQVGNVAETITVDTGAPLVETQPGSLGQVVEGKVVEQMPLNGRNVFNLLTLAPGVVPQGSTGGNPLGNQANGTYTNNTGFGNYQIGGGMANQSAFYLDGVPLNTSYINSPALVPTQDVIQEFRVDSNAVSAEFGRFAGGVVNMASKYGTNAFHGSAYEYIRNRALNANTYFNKHTPGLILPTPAFTQNQYGATLGGPIKRDKVFGFFSWEGFSLRRGNSITTTVPTVAMRNGDFSEFATATTPNVIFDPLTTCGVSGTPACPAGRSPGRLPFAGNKIPLARLDIASAQYLKLYGLPTSSGTLNNFQTNVSLGGNTNQYTGRTDWTVSDKQRLFGRYTYWAGTSKPSDPFHVNFGGLNSYTGSQNFVLGDTYSFNARTTGDVRAAYVRSTNGFIPQQVGTDLSTFGPAWAALASQVTVPVAPLASISGIFGFGGTYNRSFVDDYSLSGSLIRVAGRHTLKMGGEVRRNEWNFGQSGTAAGTFSFDSGFTSQIGSAGPGNPFASFYLGNPASGSAASVAFTHAFQWYSGLYLQDTFAMTRNFTITAGGRWELPRGFTEKNDRLTVMLPDATDPLGARVGLPLKGQIALVNSALYPDRTQVQSHFKLFSPRVNLAYAPTANTSVRAGYGISWIPPDMINYSMSPFQSPVNAATTTAVTSVGGTTSLLPAATFSNPFPGGLIPPIGHDPSRLSILEGQSVTSPIPNEQFGYAQQWNFEVQQQFTSGLALDLGYAGSKATHLSFSTVQRNQLPDATLALGASVLNQQVANPFYGTISSGLLSNPTVSRAQLLRPYPQFQNFQDTAGAVGDSHWNALEMRLRQRFKSGGLIQGSYTWAKLISNTDTLTSWLEADHGTGGVQNWNNLRAEKSLASFDVRHRLVVSYVVDLPFGRGKAFLGNVGGFGDRLIGGWSVNGITTLQSGLPLALTTAVNNTNSQGGGSRPNVVLGVPKTTSGRAQDRLSNWFNQAAFVAPAAFTFGNESRVDTTLRNAGIANYDFTLAKSIPIKERLSFQFRTEVFNLFNRVQFGEPGRALGNNTFGVVSSQTGNPRLIQFAGRLSF